MWKENDTGDVKVKSRNGKNEKKISAIPAELDVNKIRYHGDFTRPGLLRPPDCGKNERAKHTSFWGLRACDFQQGT